MTESERKRALVEIEKLEENNRQMESELKELEAIHDKDEDTLKKITFLSEKINSNNNSLMQLKELLKKEVEKQIDKFNTDSVRIEQHLQKIKASLVLESSAEDVNVSELLTGLTDEIKEFETAANDLVEEMNEFKELTGRDDFNLTPKEIKAKVKEFKTKLRDLKRQQIVKYNARVERINEAIKGYKETITVNEEAYDLVQKIEFLPLCEATVGEWRHISYLSQIDYNKMLETVKKIKEIEEKLKKEISYDSFENDLNYIADNIFKLEVELGDEIDYAAVVRINQALENISDLLLDFGTRLESAKGEMPLELYEKYNTRYKSLMISYLALQKKLKDVEKNVDKEEIMDYDKLSQMIEGIDLEIVSFSFGVESLYGKVLTSGSSIFENKHKQLVEKAKDFVGMLEDAYANKLIDDNQYQNLNAKLDQVVAKINQVELKLKEPEMFSINQSNDIYAFLNGTVDGLEKSLNELEQKLEKLEKPIKDKQVRKNIDAIFKKLELEIKNLEKQLELYKDKDPQKYEETNLRLKNAKKKLSVLSKKYRKKCPLLVRTVKSAKAFFKKYKKVLLIIAGLAAFAMLAHSVIIPAIMHGNIMVSAFSPALRGPIKTINNLLGGLIGATKSNLGIWTLANGVRLNSSAATSSLLKGLAISGVGSAALVAPVIVAVKKLIEKINMAELKQKLVEGKNAVVSVTKKGATAAKNVAVAGVNVTKEKITDIVDTSKAKNARRQAMRDVKKTDLELVKDFNKSGITAEEYIEIHQLTGYQAEMLYIIEKNNIEKMAKEDRRKGGK